MSDDSLSLSKAIQSLRKELKEAQKEGPDAGLRFLIEDITLDLQLVASVKAEGGGSVGWSVFGAKAGAEASQTNTHRIQLKMKLAPDASGKPQLIGDDEVMD
ncbi:trypco2 family protein [Rhodospirillum sp. A1_3_36]|uniref:trypco2 family protein n=1 Tax=Rhodospirillum sp. A1_3_36 TaxID=3391666 RepID=UPI0039A48B7E